MEPSFGFCDVVICVYFWLLLGCSLSFGAESDILCLKSIKDSLEDPFNSLATWNFSNKTEGFICRFTGVECWHVDESRVLNIKLSDLGLKGQFPRGIMNCSSMTGLDLSYSGLSGTLPADICSTLTMLTRLDLSFNEFTGSIPADLSNCNYLGELKLNNNKFSGRIPAQLGQLGRMKTINMSDNHLTGPIPKFMDRLSADSFANNPGLCGAPLDFCPQRSSHVEVIAGAALGYVILAPIGYCIGVAIQNRFRFHT